MLLYSAESNDFVSIQGLTVSASVGVTEQERSRKQKLLIDVQMELALPFASLEDNISLTANYSETAQEIRNFCEMSSYRLIETLASKIAELIVDKFPVKRVGVRVRKFALADAESVAVQAIRERSY